MAMGRQGYMEGLLDVDERLVSECSQSTVAVGWPLGLENGTKTPPCGLSRKRQLQLEYGPLT